MTAVHSADPKRHRIDEILDQACVFDDLIERQLRTALSTLPDSLLAHNYGVMDPAVLVRLISLAAPLKGRKILTVGVENGLVAALLCALKIAPFSVEADAARAQLIRKYLDAHGFSGALTRITPVHKGWPEFAPFDAVIVLGQPSKIDSEIFKQVSSRHGRVVCLTGDSQQQTVTVWEKVGTRLSQTDFETVNAYVAR